MIKDWLERNILHFPGNV